MRGVYLEDPPAFDAGVDGRSGHGAGDGWEAVAGTRDRTPSRRCTAQLLLSNLLDAEGLEYDGDKDG